MDSLPRAEPSAELRPIRPADTAGLARGIVWAETITPNELREHAFVLASDSMQGRETGTLGQRRAATYLGRSFAALGLPPVGPDSTLFQRIAFERATWGRVRMSVNGVEFRHLRDFYSFPGGSYPLDTAVANVVYLGYGIDAEGYSDYRQAGDLTGRVGIVVEGEPFGKKGKSLLTGTKDTSAYANIAHKREVAAARGLAALLVVEPSIQRGIAKNRARILDSSLRVLGPDTEDTSSARLNVLYVSPNVLTALVGKRRRAVVKARKRGVRKGGVRPVELPDSLKLELEPVNSRLEGVNVLGYIRGGDPELADELVVMSAHYDHLGARGETVFYGADDNASGTSTVLECAEAFAAAARAGQAPRRSVLCLLVSGEEKGLLGSAYYAEHPVFPLDATVADVNIDMIGRYDEAHADSNAYTYVIGAGRISPDLDSVNRAVNDAYAKLELDYTFEAEDDPNRFYYRSDHYNFARNGVPSVFYFSGVHEDYHQPSDTPDKLDFGKMARVGRHAFLVAWTLANRDDRLGR